MTPAPSSNPDKAAIKNMEIKKEVDDSSGEYVREELSAPLSNSTISYDQKATTANPSDGSRLSSVRDDVIKEEDGGHHSGSSQQMQTRKSSRLKTSTSTSTGAASSQPMPQIESDILVPEAKSNGTTRGAEAHSKDDSQDQDDENRDLKKQLAQVRRNSTIQSTKLSKSEQKVSRLERELIHEKEKVKSKRDEYQKKIKSGPITMGDDGQMRNLLLKLGEMCKDWAEKYAIPDEAGRTYNMAEKSSILSLLNLRYEAVSGDGEAKVFDGMTNCAEILLNAALTHLVWFEILERPFHFLEHASTIIGPPGIQTALKWLVDLGDCSGDVAQKYTYCWLGTLIKTLNPTSTAEADGPLEKAARSKNKVMKDAAFKELENVLKRHCEVLLRRVADDEAKKRDARLLHICRQAHETAQKLWTQGYKIECFTRRSLPQTFRNKTTLMNAHLTMLIDQTTTSKDGQQIYLVTKPGVQAYGNEKGEFETAQRTLDPATVCIASKEDLEQAARAWWEEQENHEHAIVGSGTMTSGSQEVAQKNKEETTEHARSNLGTKKKQQAASGFPEAGASLKIAGGDASSKVQTPLTSATHGPDSPRAKYDVSAPNHQNQNSSANTGNFKYLRDHEIVMERVNTKTGKRKRIARYLEIVNDDDDSVESSADGVDNDELTRKRGRLRKRPNRSGENEGEKKTETKWKHTETNQASPASKQKSMRPGVKGV